MIIIKSLWANLQDIVKSETGKSDVELSKWTSGAAVSQKRCVLFIWRLHYFLICAKKWDELKPENDSFSFYEQKQSGTGQSPPSVVRFMPSICFSWHFEQKLIKKSHHKDQNLYSSASDCFKISPVVFIWSKAEKCSWHFCPFLCSRLKLYLKQNCPEYYRSRRSFLHPC